MRHCVITGAADGIGKALARRFAIAGYVITGVDRDLELAARTQAELEREGHQVAFVSADLANQADIERALAELAGKQRIDVLVNNAGINNVGRFATSDLRQQQAVLDINFQAPLLLTAGLLAQGRIAPHGTLVYISSLSHFVSYPGATVYAAGKDGLAAYARSLRTGLKQRGIDVLTVYPGPTRTAHARRYSPDNRRENRRMPPDTLATFIVDAVHARRAELVVGFGNRAFAVVGQVLPQLTAFAIRKTLFEKLEP